MLNGTQVTPKPSVRVPWRRTHIAKRKRRRAPNDGGSIDQRPSGRWRLRVRLNDRQAVYST